MRLSVWTAGRYLARWGFTPQKPVRRAFEQDPEAVCRWLEEEYPEIRKQAKVEKAEIYWGDEMVNNDVRTNAVGRRRARDREELVANVRGYLRGRQRRPDVVKAYFHEEHVRYAAD